MKFKSLLKIGLPLLGVSALAISLPLALTSCGDNTSSQNTKSPITFQENLKDTTTVKKGQNFLELSVKVVDKNQDKQLGYQWFYKKPTLDTQSLTKLSSDNTNSLQGFEKITNNPTANSSTLKVAADLEEGNDYEVVCAVYEVNKNKDSNQQTSTYLFSNVTKIVVDKDSSQLNDSTVTTTNINNLSNLTSTLTKQNLESSENVKDGNVVENSALYTAIFNQLGEDAKESIKTISLTNATKQSDSNVLLDITLSLKENYTWSVDVFKQGEGLNVPSLLSGSLNFVINEDGSLTVKDIPTSIKNNEVVTETEITPEKDLAAIKTELAKLNDSNKNDINVVLDNSESNWTVKSNKIDAFGQQVLGISQAGAIKSITLTKGEPSSSKETVNIAIELNSGFTWGSTINSLWETSASGKTITLQNIPTGISEVKNDTEITPSNNLEAIKTKLAQLSDSNKSNINAILDNSGSNWTVKSNKIDAFGQQVLGISQAGAIKSITLTKGAPTDSKETVNIAVELNTGYSWTTNINTLWGAAAIDKTVTLQNIPTGINEVKKDTEITPSNNLEAIKTELAKLNDSNKSSISAILDNSGSSWMVKSNKIDAFGQQVLGISQAGAIKSITLTKGVPSGSKETVNIAVELNTGYAWTSNINTLWSTTATGKVVILQNIPTDIATTQVNENAITLSETQLNTINTILNNQLGSSWTTSSGSNNTPTEKEAAILTAIKADTNFKSQPWLSKMESVTVTLNDANQSSKQTASVKINFASGVTLTAQSSTYFEVNSSNKNELDLKTPITTGIDGTQNGNFFRAFSTN